MDGIICHESTKIHVPVDKKWRVMVHVFNILLFKLSRTEVVIDLRPIIMSYYYNFKWWNFDKQNHFSDSQSHWCIRYVSIGYRRIHPSQEKELPSIWWGEQHWMGSIIVVRNHYRRENRSWIAGLARKGKHIRLGRNTYTNHPVLFYSQMDGWWRLFFPFIQTMDGLPSDTSM